MTESGEAGADRVALLEKAILAAARAHRGQVYRGYGQVPDEPYILHPMRVMAAVPQEARVVAVLHDVLEDCGPEHLEGLELVEEEREALELVTHRKNEETYGEYLERLCGAGNRLALLVKRADLQVNMRPPYPAHRRPRYAAALELGEEALRRLRLAAARASLGLEEQPGSAGEPERAATVEVPPDEAERFERELVTVEIQQDALYNSLETAILLGFRGNDKSRRNAVSSIPEDQLVRTPTGPNGGNITYRGRDILAYLELRRSWKSQGRR